MAQFYRNSLYEAIQYRGDNYQEIVDWLVIHGTGFVIEEEDDGVMYREYSSHSEDVLNQYINGWLILAPGGTVAIMSNENFQGMYVAV